MLSEPWDGPAALCFTDGRTCGAALDRNGLRPLRVAITDDGLVDRRIRGGGGTAPEGARVERARLGPGGILVVDPERGLLLGDELRRELARRRPYGAWVAASTVDRATRASRSSPATDASTRGTSSTATRART